MVSRPLVLTATCLLLSGLAIACGDDGGGTTGTTADTTTSSGTTTTDTTGTTGTTTDAPTTSPPTTGTSDGTTTGTTAPATTTGTTTGTTTDTTTGGGVDCAAIPMGPFEPVYLGGGFNGSEDLGFDGAGGLALKGGDQVVIVTADLQDTLLATGLPQTYGTRFAIDGQLLVALPNQGKLQAIATDGTITDVATGLQGPNGLHVDPTGGIWVTEFGGSRVIRFAPDYSNKTTVYEGNEAASANGVVLDPARGLLFFTNYGAGRLLKIAVDDQGQAIGAPAEVATVQGAKLDGLVLDACGNVYAVDQGNSRLYRFWLDDQAVIVGAPELLAEFDDNVANAQFGQGDGWEPESLYLSGNPGEIYAVPVGVPGAPIGLPG